ncbi:hypothetical protein [Microbacterium sp. E-13]|uniref:hypothetical protein n=1 Tax=Microbacterium sp. E-13 TaxID=3404048 RepID=UPI003CED86BC
MANDYNTAWDVLATAIGAAAGTSSGSVDDIEHMTVDQQLKVAEVAALLSIAQEISALNPNNTYGFDSEGKKRNAWGFEIP